MDHVVVSETGMPLSRPMEFVESESSLNVLVRWNAITNSEDTLEPIAQVFGGVPKLIENRIKRKNTQTLLTDSSKSELHLCISGLS